jgi:hypothetical protein
MSDLRHRAALAVVVLGCAAALAACGHDDPTEPPDEVDQARIASVQGDPALVGAVAQIATTNTGSSNSPYFRAQVVRDGGDATPAQLTAQVRAAGWRVTSVSCRDAATAAPGPAVSVQAFRTMPDELIGGGSYTVGLRIEDSRMIAVIPYHLDVANPWGAPDITIPAAQSCAETRAAPRTAGQAVAIDRAAAPGG